MVATTADRQGTGTTGALAVRRWLLVATPALAGAFLVLGAVADPAPGLQGQELAQAYADAPDRVQFKSFGYHFAFGFLGIMTFLLAGHIRRRGAWLANVAAVLAFLGITTLPGFILADFYDSAIVQVAGLGTYTEISRTLEEMWALAVLAGTGGAGLLVSVPLIAAATWRAGLVPWFAAALPVVGLAAFVAASSEIGAGIFAVLFAAFSWTLWRHGVGRLEETVEPNLG